MIVNKCKGIHTKFPLRRLKYTTETCLLRNFNIFRMHTHFCHMEFVIYDLLAKKKYNERDKKHLCCGETKKELTSIFRSDCEN